MPAEDVLEPSPQIVSAFHNSENHRLHMGMQFYIENTQIPFTASGRESEIFHLLNFYHRLGEADLLVEVCPGRLTATDRLSQVIRHRQV